MDVNKIVLIKFMKFLFLWKNLLYLPPKYHSACVLQANHFTFHFRTKILTTNKSHEKDP